MEPANVTRLAEMLRLSPQEASRHLGRLARLDLVARGAGRAYATTPYGRAVLEELPVLGSLLARRAFFRDHDLGGLPAALPVRPLAAAVHEAGPPEANVRRAAAAVAAARTRVRFVGDRAEPLAAALAERAAAGVEVDLVLGWTAAAGEGLLRMQPVPAGEGPPRLTLRLVDEARMVLLATEREALAFFPDRAGRIDLGHLVRGSDAPFLRWAEEVADAVVEGATLAYAPGRADQPPWDVAVTRAAAAFIKGRKRGGAR